MLQQPSIKSRRAGGLVLALLAVAQVGAQEPVKMPDAPDFSQREIAASVHDLSEAWDAWTTTTGDIEQRAVNVPMSEARYLIQRALGRYLDFLDKRAAYSDAVLAYIEDRRLHPRARLPLVTAEDVYAEQARLIGVNVLVLHQKLNALKDAAEWTAVYSPSDAEASQVLKLQSARRAEIPVILSASSAPPPEAMSSLGYRKSEREVEDALLHLWTRYYQALVDAIEQRPSGAMALTPIRAHGSGTATTIPSFGQPAPEAWKTFVGAWSYTSGSQQFNGVAEPVSALLEIWFENNNLVGRYRAKLPDFEGIRRIDLRLEGTPANNGRQLTMRFASQNPPEKGQLVLEPAGSSGLDIMLVRSVSAQSHIPRGRELLVRR